MNNYSSAYETGARCAYKYRMTTTTKSVKKTFKKNYSSAVHID